MGINAVKLDAPVPPIGTVTGVKPLAREPVLNAPTVVIDVCPTYVAAMSITTAPVVGLTVILLGVPVTDVTAPVAGISTRVIVLPDISTESKTVNWSDV